MNRYKITYKYASLFKPYEKKVMEYFIGDSDSLQKRIDLIKYWRGYDVKAEEVRE